MKRNLLLTIGACLLMGPFLDCKAAPILDPGLWCNGRDSVFLYDGRALPANIDCQFNAGPKGPFVPYWRYRLLEDGRWQWVDSDNVPREPPVFLAPGTLENFSSLAIAGKTSKVFIHSPVLDDLLQGGKTEWLNAQTKDIYEKRVAVILSSQTISELDRFKRERQALIDSSASIQDAGIQKARKEFIAASNPDLLLTNVVKVLRNSAKEVVPVDDLASFKKGRYDYALIVHWKSFTRFDLLEEFDTFPGGDYSDWAGGRVPAYMGHSVSGILINPDMKATWIFNSFRPYVNMKGNSYGQRKSRNESIEEYFRYLAYNFRQDWGNEDVISGGYTAATFR